MSREALGRTRRGGPGGRLALALLLLALLAGCVGPRQEDAPDYRRLQSEALLTRVPFPALVVEVDYAKGREPSPLALDALMATLAEVADKEEIVLLPPRQLPDEPRFRGEAVWTTDEAYAVHAAFFDSGPVSTVRFGQGRNATLHVLYLNGHDGGNGGDGAYGFQHYNVAYLFPDRIRDGTPVASDAAPRFPNLAADRIERAVLVHEVGHALGLVDRGAPMLHERLTEDGAHSRYKGSVMYPSLHGTFAVLDPLLGEDSTPYRFDRYDLADLAAVRQRMQVE